MKKMLKIILIICIAIAAQLFVFGFPKFGSQGDCKWMQTTHGFVTLCYWKNSQTSGMIIIKNKYPILKYEFELEINKWLNRPQKFK